MSAAVSQSWIDDRHEVLSLGHALARGGAFDAECLEDTFENLFHYLHKPWKWSEEHTAWNDAGRPSTFPRGGL